MDKRVTPRGKVKYRVRWIGCPLDEASWLDEQLVGDDLIEEYDAKQQGRRIQAMFTSTTLSTPAEVTPFSYEMVMPKEGTKLERRILYIAKLTKPYERHYESTSRELCCAVWAFNKLRFMVESYKPILVTDHASIREVLTSAMTMQYSLRIHKFRSLLSPYINDIHVHYRPGKLYLNVDALSRARWIGGQDMTGKGGTTQEVEGTEEKRETGREEKRDGTGIEKEKG